MGIDIERKDPGRTATMSTQLTDRERALEHGALSSVHEFYTVLWTMKEGLSKVLRCGLMTPFSLLEVDALEVDGPFSTGTFKNFAQYRAVAFPVGDHVVSVALPRRTEVDLRPFRSAAEALAAAIARPPAEAT